VQTGAGLSGPLAVGSRGQEAPCGGPVRRWRVGSQRASKERHLHASPYVTVDQTFFNYPLRGSGQEVMWKVGK
jgi:hypothetical protein